MRARKFKRVRVLIKIISVWGVIISSPSLWSQTVTTELLEKGDETVFSQFKFLKDHSQIASRCTDCHKEQDHALAQSVHGKTGLLSKMPKGTMCLTCHEVNHIVNDPRHVQEFNLKPIAKLNNKDTCIRCHSSETLGAIYNFPPYVPSNFEQSMHHRKSALGDKSAPSCADCHGGHGILRKTDPNSPMYSLAQRTKVCAQCHVGANINFAATFDHKPINIENKPLEYIVLSGYRGLTLATFLALGFFMLLDLMTMVRNRLFKHTPHKKPQKVRFVQRMDKSQRIQHFLLLSSMIILFLTAWPLLAADSLAAQNFTKALGGVKSIACAPSKARPN